MARYDSFEYSKSKRIYKHAVSIPVRPFTAAKARKVKIIIDGTEVKAEVAPYTYGTFKRYQQATTERLGSGIYLVECERALYEYGNKLYKYYKYRDEDGTWHTEYVPYDGGAYGRHGTGLDPIEVHDGIIAA